jgi:hypothetical protein
MPAYYLVDGGFVLTLQFPTLTRAENLTLADYYPVVHPEMQTRAK